MASQRVSAVGWTARIVGLLTVLLAFIQWWGESQARREPLASGEIPGTWVQQWALTTHLLPALVLLVALVLAWRRPLVGAVIFGGMAVGVTVGVIVSLLEWGYLSAVLPHYIAGILFFADWWLTRQHHPSPGLAT